MSDPQSTVVIACIGEVVDRSCGVEPRALIVEAATIALSRAPLLRPLIDQLDVISLASFRYAQIERFVAADLGIDPPNAAESSVGGEMPIRLLVELAEKVSSGAMRAALLCGGEALRTKSAAANRGEPLDWGPADPNARPTTALDYVTEQAARHGLTWPINVYPLYENAARHAWRQSLVEAQNESAGLWARFSQAAAANPYAWSPTATSAEEIGADTPANRMIAFPYRKLMVANPNVNQAAAVLVTSLFNARRAGIADEDLIFIGNGTRANEPRDFLQRDRYDRSAAQEEVLEATLADNGMTAEKVDLWELYSCFPTVPKMARRTLGLAADVAPSVTGGLTFFGAPANNYMTHAITGAVRALREGQGRTAFLYGQGEFVTKHAAVLLSREPLKGPPRMRDVQAKADARMDPIPALLDDYEGPVTIESYTLIYGRDGAATQAPIVARTPGGSRTVALGDLGDPGLAVWLEARNGDPIGEPGRITRGPDSSLLFKRI